MDQRTDDTPTWRIRARVREFSLTTNADVIMVGIGAPLDGTNLHQALSHLGRQSLIHIRSERESPDLLIDSSLARQIPLDRLLAFLRMKVEPLMDSTETLAVTLQVRCDIRDINGLPNLPGAVTELADASQPPP